MPSPPRTVLDGLEDVWDGAARGWRETNRRREEADAAKAEAARRLADIASGAVENLADGAKAGVVAASTQARNSQAAAVMDALFGNRTTRRPQSGPVDPREMGDRVRATEDDIRQGLEGARMSGDPAALAGAWPAAAGAWVARVRPGGAWDDKGRYPPRQRQRYERQGNFSYGATAAALGIPEQVALRAAGVVQRAQAVGDALAGARGPQIRERAGGYSAPYGDDPRDQRSISEGYAYGGRAVAGRKSSSSGKGAR